MVRQARPEKQAGILRGRLELMDTPTRQLCYGKLTDGELELLCGAGAADYIASLPDATVEQIAFDRSGQTAEREYQPTFKGLG